MADVLTFTAEVRDRAGKGVARAIRRAGKVPAVIYGEKMETLLISLDGKELGMYLSEPGFFTHVFEVKLNGDTHQVLARDLHLDPVTDRPLHVDFLRFSANTQINVEVPVTFINEEECPGIKEGGVLNVVRREVELICSPTNIPQELIADLAGLEIGDSIHISAIPLPQGVELEVTDRDFTIATIAAPTVEEEPEPEEAAEGEEGAVAEGEEGAAAEGAAEEKAEGGGEDEDKD